MSYRLWPAQITAAGFVGIFLLLSWVPAPNAKELATLGARFEFAKLAMPSTGTAPTITSHPVNPIVAHLERWMSAIGTAVSLGDLDEDGVSNDLCFVEPRTGEVVAAPAPGTSERYAPFVLQSDPAWDPHTHVPTGCKFGDFNEDGLADLLVHFVGRTPLLFLRATAEGAPTLAAYRMRPLLAEDTPWWTSTIVQSDVDLDGHIDLIVGNYFPDGQVIFGENASGPVTMQDSFSRARNAGINRIYLWTGGSGGPEPTASFAEVPDPFPDDDETAWTLAVGAADLDKDGASELYFANDFGPDCLYSNQSTPGHVELVRLHGSRGFFIPTSLVLGNDSFKGMGVDFGDVNGDGFFDIFVSNITAHGGLEESTFLFVSDGKMEGMAQGHAPYDDVGEALGVSRSSWGWDTRFADFDNDGVLELMQATGFLKGEFNYWGDMAEIAGGHDAMVPNPANWPAFPVGADLSGHDPEPFYVLRENGRYADLSTTIGFDGAGGGWNSRGLATADVDRDGDMDLALANQWEESWFFRNDTSSPGRSLGLHIVHSPDARGVSVASGSASGHETWPAIGAFATVELPDGRKLVRQVDGGSGHAGASAQELLFGLGDVPADHSLPVHLQWRDMTGKLHASELSLLPGWHTITLGSES
jgi:hypothetical protein